MSKRTRKHKRKPRALESQAPALPADRRHPRRRQCLEVALALGMAIIVMLRPFRDGMTYPGQNAYFLWAIAFLTSCWAMRLLILGERIRFGGPILALLVFWGICLLTAFDTVQFDATYRSLLYWAGHVFVFVLAANAFRCKGAIGVVVGAFVLTSLAEAGWALAHFKIVLPRIRLAVEAQPDMLEGVLATGVASADFMHRLSVNRAFGSLMFPNALAGFVILGIPLALAGVLHSILVLKEAFRTPLEGGRMKRGPIRRFGLPIAAGLLACLAAEALAYGWWTLYYGNDVIAQHATAAAFLYGVAPAAVTVIPLLVLLLFGGHICWLFARLVCFVLTVGLEVVALWYSYSRGGMLAVTAACSMGGLLLILSWKRSRPGKRSLSAAKTALIILVFGAAGVSVAANSAAPTANTKPPAQARASGQNVTMDDLLNPATMALRLSYWRTGWAMARANFWTGVGLGNFGTVYPTYKYLGAGDVKTAHNDFLEVLCETGALGFLLFTGFWAYFVYWGAARILREPAPLDRLVLTGGFCGVLAFLLHAVVDFNFHNPGLAFFAFLLAGLFFSRASLASGSAEKHIKHQLMAIPLVIAAVTLVGASVRPWAVDYALGGYKFLRAGMPVTMNWRMRAARFLLSPPDPPGESAHILLLLVPDRHKLERFGGVFTRQDITEGRYRRVTPEEPLPSDAAFVLDEPESAYETGISAAETILDDLERADATWYPHSPFVATTLNTWYFMLYDHANHPEAKRRYAWEALKWAKRETERSPHQWRSHDRLAKTLWFYGNVEQGPRRGEHFRRGLEAFRKVTELYPTFAEGWQQYGNALVEYGAALKKAGDTSIGDPYLISGRKALARAQEISQRLQGK
ncbi:MAG TPA: O-antigen ligase family protein [Candidatus Hydrogenedentes bacterium]|nr:O-antigen ligase family protein [Candidatus Hydrogenedentota bacterium]HIJ73913.1 O-antigen ligase family protein [Candidatus Hydrogenedentota bacterium]